MLYPQYLFAKEIVRNSYKISHGDVGLGVDIPCGSGYTTYCLAKQSKIKWMGIDLDNKSISFAKKNYQSNILSFSEEDIFQKLNQLDGVDILCVINSIFLLPDHNILFESIYKCLKPGAEVFFIIPNIESVNYKEFIRIYPNINLKEYLPSDFLETLNKYKFNANQFKGICYANIYGRKELKYLSRLAPFYLYILNLLFTFFKKGTPSYFLFKVTK